MDEAKLESSIKVSQYNSIKRPFSALNKVKIPSKSLNSKIFPLSRTHQSLKLQRFHPHSIAIRSLLDKPSQDLELTTKKIIYNQFPQRTLKKQSFSLQSIPEKGRFLNISEGQCGNEREEVLRVSKNQRPNTARVVRNGVIDENQLMVNKFLPKRGKECVGEMLKIWEGDKRGQVTTEESDEDYVQKELLLRISDIDYYLKSEKSVQLNPLFKTSLFNLGSVKNTSKESFVNFGLKATRKPLTQRAIKSHNNTNRLEI